MPKRTMIVVTAAAGLALAHSEARAGAAQDGVIDVRPMSAAACPTLFGRQQTHVANRAQRQGKLYWLQNSEGTITVAHASDRWRRPAPLVLVGLEVVAIKRSQAEVMVSAELAARVRCPAGRYALDRDMSIGGAAVLGVLREGLLVERRGALRFIGRPGARRPEWQMIWGSPYEVMVASAPTPARRTLRIPRYSLPR